MARVYYESEGVTLYLGDCRDVLPTLTPLDFGALVTDPPYGLAYETNHRRASGAAASWIGTQIAGDDGIAIRDAVLAWAGELPSVVFGSWKAPRPATVREVLVWDKGPASGMGDLRLPWKRSWEEVYVIGVGFVGPRDEGVLKGHSIISWESHGRAHPNEKPLTLMRYLVSKCPPGAILDPFAGSGTTLVAAKLMGRPCVGIEIEERYCEITAERLAQRVLPLEEPTRLPR